MVIGPESNTSELFESAFQREARNFWIGIQHDYDIRAYLSLGELARSSIEKVKGILTYENLGQILDEVNQTPVEPLSRLLAHHVDQFKSFEEYNPRAAEYRETGDILIPFDTALMFSLQYGFRSALFALVKKEDREIKFRDNALNDVDIMGYVGEDCSNLINRLKQELRLWRDIYMTDDSRMITLGVEPDRFCACNLPDSVHCDIQLAKGKDKKILDALRIRTDIPDMINKDNGETDIPLGVVKQYAGRIGNVVVKR
jgi:hypothetical protein